MILATWNVNSLRARLPRVLEFLEAHAPDVLLLQETKVAPDQFPEAELREAGWLSHHHSGGRWAGVAVLAKAELGLEPVRAGLPGEVRGEEARWVEADVPGLGLRAASVYVVNGREVGSETFAEKLRFLEAMAERAGELSGTPLVIGGDMNVAPQDVDVYDPAAFAGATHVTEEERTLLRAVQERGDLVDAFRVLEPGAPGFTWWDYRQGHFHRGLGLRIDLLLVSAALSGGLRSCGIDRDFRKGPKPSDHAPLLAELDPPDSGA
ncbi:MAG: exodeoxyribonuclease III [Solirubrobacteraceae bacterium]|jgi:exodeoxyribonuclease-3|nr:exodeoxyribonuclease III [Solirubrobacteraceae bacterium]MCU0314837.1 exodeoxyribonuclease III [Solirubrobacteraceae bacterium]